MTSVTWTDLSPQQQMLIVALGLDLPNVGSVGTEVMNIRPQLRAAIGSLRYLGLVEETRSAHEGVWLQITNAGRAVREQGRLK